MKKHKAYKNRLYPTPEQKALLDTSLKQTRFFYNAALANKMDYYELHKKSVYRLPTYFKKLYPRLKAADSQALTNCSRNLDKAYDKFFAKKGGFPKFKSYRNRNYSYTTNNNSAQKQIRIEDGLLTILKVKGIPMVESRKIQEGEVIKTCTISRTPTGKYFASLMVEYYMEVPVVDVKKALTIRETDDIICTFENGDVADYKLFKGALEAKLESQQRRLSGMKKGGSNYEKQRVKLAKTYEKITNQRNDYYHKLTHRIANEYDKVIVVRGDTKEESFVKLDKAFHQFLSLLTYKLGDRGKELVIVKDEEENL